MKELRADGFPFRALRLAALAFLWVVCVAAPAVAAESPAVALESGIYAEQTKGDLDAAVASYAEVIDHPDATQQQVAEALYRLGNCHERKGEIGKAREAFKRVRDAFAAQQPWSDKAAAELARLEEIHGSAPIGTGGVDLATLMPPDTLLYAEMGSPGRQVETILRMLAGTPLANPLEVIGGGRRPATRPEGGTNNQNEKTPADVVAALLNPSMVKEFKKIRGAAVGLQEVGATASGAPSFVAVLYPGESDALRGILTAALMMAGVAGEPIEGMQTVMLADGQIAAAMDEKVMILSSRPERLAWCVRRYKGLSEEPTLQSTSPSFAALSRAQREADALTVWADGARCAEMIGRQFKGGQAQQFELIDMFADFENIESLTGRVMIDLSNPGLELAANLRPGHNCLGQALFRTPGLTAAGFQAVPAEAVAVLSFCLNEPAAAEAAAQKTSELTGLDLGREVFANIEQVNLFFMPRTDRPLEGWLAQAVANGQEQVTPYLGLAVTSRDPAKTRQVIYTLLGVVDRVSAFQSQSMQGQPQVELAPPPPHELPEGVQRFAVVAQSRRDQGRVIYDKLYCYVGQAGQSTVIALAPDIAAAGIRAAQTGRCAATQGALATQLSDLPTGASKLAVVNLGGALGLFHAAMAQSNRLPPSAGEQAAEQLAQGLGTTCLRLESAESADKLILRAGVREMPPLANLFPLFMEYQRQIEAAQRERRQQAAPQARPQTRGLSESSLQLARGAYANLVQVGRAITAYRSKHNQAWPPHRLALVAEKFIPSSTLTSPVTGRKFVYIRPAEGADGNLILAYDEPLNGQAQTVALLVSGQVRHFAVNEAFRDLLARSKAAAQAQAPGETPEEGDEQ